MKTFLASLLMFVTFAAQAANFPYIRLNGTTNQISDNGTAMTRNGVAVGGGGFSGAVSNSVAVSGLLAVGTGKTNGIAATAAHVVSALGFTPANSNSIPVLTGMVSNNVASAGLLSVDSTKTNGIAATAAHVVSALGFTPANSNSIPSLTGMVSNNVASAGLLSVDSTKTNGIAATAAHVISALGFTPSNSNNVSGVANPTGTIGLSAVNGTAVSAIRSDGAPALSQAIAPTWSALHVFSAQAQVSDLLIGGMAVSRGTLTHGASVLIDFGLTNRYASCSPTGNVTFVFANVAAGKWYNVLLTMPATNCTPTFPFTGTLSNWFGGAPTQFTGGTIGSLTFFPRDTTTNAVLAAYTETQ